MKLFQELKKYWSIKMEARMDEFIDNLKFNQNGLIPAIVQDDENEEVLMLGYMNKLSLKKTFQTGKTHFWSRSRNKLWLKGETSGHYQYVKSVFIDCDKDTLLIRVKQEIGACHKGFRSCFYRKIDSKGNIEIVGEKIFDHK